MSNSRDHEWELVAENQLGYWSRYNLYRCVGCGKECRLDISADIEVASCPSCKGIAHFSSAECPDAECPGPDHAGFVTAAFQSENPNLTDDD